MSQLFAVSPFRAEQGTSLETPSRTRASSCEDVETINLIIRRAALWTLNPKVTQLGEREEHLISRDTGQFSGGDWK